jgi:predicted ABC-type ATPase
MSEEPPIVVVVAGPNGAGKSTTAPALLAGVLRVSEFVNADVIAQGLSAFKPESAAIDAGRVMLTRLRELAASRARFAFETTLASKTFAPWIGRLCQRGYEFHLVFLYLPSPDLAVERVADRVRAGGHHVPSDVVRRRYLGGIRNFFRLYQPLATEWRFYDNSDNAGPRLIATGSGAAETMIADPGSWQRVKDTIADDRPAEKDRT